MKCSIKGCDREKWAKSYCLMHYKRVWRGGKVGSSETLRNYHGMSARDSQHPLYSTWEGIRDRCYNKNRNGYKNYGGRGIKVCKRWDNFANFLADMGERPEGCTIDRIDVNGDYAPDNCRWATKVQQSRNKRMLPNNTSGYTGVSWHVQDSLWEVRIGVNGKTKRLGLYKNINDAIQARIEGEEKYWSDKTI